MLNAFVIGNKVFLITARFIRQFKQIFMIDNLLGHLQVIEYNSMSGRALIERTHIRTAISRSRI